MSTSTVFFRSQGVQGKVEAMNPWYSVSFFLAASSPPVSLACVSDMFILFILLWIGRTVAYRGKRWSSLTFLCVVITEETAAALAGLYSLALSLSITTSYFCWGKYLHFSVAFPSCLLFGFLFVNFVKGFLGSSLHLWRFSAA